MLVETTIYQLKLARFIWDSVKLTSKSSVPAFSVVNMSLRQVTETLGVVAGWRLKFEHRQTPGCVLPSEYVIRPSCVHKHNRSNQLSYLNRLLRYSRYYRMFIHMTQQNIRCLWRCQPCGGDPVGDREVLTPTFWHCGSNCTSVQWCGSETVGPVLWTRPVSDQNNRSWSWSCRYGVVLWLVKHGLVTLVVTTISASVGQTKSAVWAKFTEFIWKFWYVCIG